MPRLTKFQEEWLSLKDSTGNEVRLWCKEGKDEYHCVCSFCQKQIAVGNSGKLQLLQHASTAKHKKAVSSYIDPCQVKLTTISTATGEKGLCLPTKSASSTSSWNYSDEEKIISSEILYILYAAVNNISFSACDGVSKLLSRMFPDCKAAKDIKLSSRKISYEISHGLGPYFLSKISKDVENCLYYTLMYDESLNEANLKQLDVHVQFWNIKTNEIQHSYIGSEMLKHATATDIDSAIMNSLDRANIPIKKLIMLGSDGPNVNKAVFKIFDQRVKSIEKEGLINVGTCNLHVMHNAFGKGLKIEAFASVTEFLEDIDIWFKKYPSRQEDLMMTANNSDEEDDVCNTLRYISNRWLSIVPACQRIIQMYNILEKHFQKDLVEKKSPLLKNERYKRISNGFNSPLTLAYLNFLVSVGTVFENFLRFLQSDTPLIHMLYDEMLGVVKKLLNRFISGMEEFPNDDDIIEIPLKKVMDREKLKHLDVGSEARKVLSSVDSTEKHCFRLNAQDFYFTVTSYLLEKLPFKNVLLKSIQVLHPLARKEPASKTTPVVKKLVQILSRCIQKGDCDKIIDEWKIYTVDDDIKEEWSQVQSGDCIKWAPVDKYWGKVLSLNGTSLEKKYFHLSKIVKVALCLSHGQAIVERGFSINKRMMNDRARMSLASIIGLRLIKDNVKKDDVSETVISKEMITFYKEAHGKYKAELLNQPKKTEEPKDSFKLPTPEEKLSSLKKDVSSAHKLIEEGNDRLAAALKRKSFDDIAAAQALIAAGNKKLKASK